MEKKSDLRLIPGVGKSIEQDFIRLGYRCIADLKGENPEKIYERDCQMKGYPVDRCMLYVYRLAVYFAQEEHPEAEKLKWWNWKD